MVVDTIVRRCCTNDCGDDGSIGMHEGRNPVYFCSDDMCNGEMADERLGSGGKSSSAVAAFSTQASLSLSCYECTGHNPSCGTGDTVLVHQCKACMVYSNQFDGGKCPLRRDTFDVFDRRYRDSPMLYLRLWSVGNHQRI